VDLKEATETRNHIVQANLRLIVALARKLTISLEQMSDLISEGTTPLIRSVELFDISLGNRFSTYATWAVRNQMLRWLKRVRNSPERCLGEDAPAWETLPDRRREIEIPDVAHDARVAAVRRLLASLSERERQVLTARFALEGQPCGQSLADIAGQMGLSKERVRQIAMTTLTKLRECISVEEFESLR
jgi:RNA polymerase primary sigma factor